MLPEGHGRVKAFVKVGCAAPMTNGLLENSTIAIEKLWKQRGYDPKKPDVIKARLGYALDKYEACAHLATGAMHKPTAVAAGGMGHRQAHQEHHRRERACWHETEGAAEEGRRAAASQVVMLLRAAASLNLVVDKATGPPAPAPAPAPAPHSQH